MGRKKKEKQRDTGGSMGQLVDGVAPLQSLEALVAERARSVPDGSLEDAFAEGYERGFRAGMDAARRGASGPNLTASPDRVTLTFLLSDPYAADAEDDAPPGAAVGRLRLSQQLALSLIEGLRSALDRPDFDTESGLKHRP